MIIKLIKYIYAIKIDMLNWLWKYNVKKYINLYLLLKNSKSNNYIFLNNLYYVFTRIGINEQVRISKALNWASFRELEWLDLKELKEKKSEYESITLFEMSSGNIPLSGLGYNEITKIKNKINFLYLNKLIYAICYKDMADNYHLINYNNLYKEITISLKNKILENKNKIVK